jgi:hypothetical protein
MNRPEAAKKIALKARHATPTAIGCPVIRSVPAYSGVLACRISTRWLLSFWQQKRQDPSGRVGSWSLLFRGQRILALDVNPGRHHRNLLRSGTVSGTHWQRWPVMDAEADEREQNFAAWHRAFLMAANIVTTFQVLSPPRGVQLRLIVNEDFDRRKPKDNGS